MGSPSKFPNKSAEIFLSKSQSRSARMFQDKNAQRYPSKSQGRNASKFLNKNAATCPSRVAKGYQSRSASKFPGKNVAKFPANHAQKFQSKSAHKSPSRSAKTSPVRSAATFPSNPAAKSPKSPVQHFTSALYAHNPPMADSSKTPKSNLSTIREPIWNRLHSLPPTQSLKPYQVLFIVLFIPCLWNDKHTPENTFFQRPK